MKRPRRCACGCGCFVRKRYVKGHSIRVNRPTPAAYRRRSLKMRGANHPGWKGGYAKDFNGYVKIRLGPKRYRRLHRVVMERALGRRLPPGLVVHHKNGDTSDNRLGNLELMTRAQHIAEHRGELLAARGIHTYKS